MSELLQKAQDIAAYYHNGQVDKGGVPYICHVLRVSAAGATEDEQVLGALHDLYEDTECTATLIIQTFGGKIACALVSITREPGEAYSAYIDRVGKDPLARAVKIIDLKDNIGRLGLLKCKDASRAVECDGLHRRYTRALNQLGGA